MDKTLVKGVDLLGHLVDRGHPCGVHELARVTGLPPSNVHRTLQTWLQLGFVAQEPGGGYHCTLKLFEWGCRVAGTLDVKRVAREHLVRIARATEETIHLSVLEGADIVYLDKVESPQPVRAYSEIGARAPAHCVATGKVLLAFGGDEAFAALAPRLARATEHTICDRDVLRAQLERIRHRGYAVNHQEWRLGVSGLGAPVFDQQGVAVAAVGLSAPSGRLGEARERELGAQLVATAQAVSHAIGGTAVGRRAA